MESSEPKTLSPRDLAAAVGVSQSSIKRWVDAGLIQVSRTAGGHRRIQIAEALRFVRDKKMSIVRPDLLGMSGVATTSPTGAPPDGRALFELLSKHRVQDARSLVLGWYVGGHALASIFDGPISEALAEFGTLWNTREDGIYREHLATSSIIEAISLLHGLIREAPIYAPAAVGGAIENDRYIIPSMMASCLFREAGFNVVNLGANTPASSFLTAAEHTKAQVVWISTKAPIRSKTRVDDIRSLMDDLIERDIRVIVGGSEARRLLPLPTGAKLMNSMKELADDLAGYKTD